MTLCQIPRWNTIIQKPYTEIVANGAGKKKIAFFNTEVHRLHSNWVKSEIFRCYTSYKYICTEGRYINTCQQLPPSSMKITWEKYNNCQNYSSPDIRMSMHGIDFVENIRLIFYFCSFLWFNRAEEQPITPLIDRAEVDF